MKRIRQIGGIVPAALLGGAIALAVIGSGSEVVSAQTTVAPNADAGGTEADSLRPAERTFVVQALTTGRQQAELASLAATHAHGSDIRDFAQQLVTDYRQINTALETLARRKAIDIPLQPTSYSDDYRALAENNGTSFDHAFVAAVAEANNRTMRLLSEALAGGKDPDVRDVAGSMLPVVRDHVNKTTELEKTF